MSTDSVNLHKGKPVFSPELELSSRQEVVRDYVNSLIAFRERAYGRPLHPGWTFSSLIKPYDAPVSDTSMPTRRQLPRFAHCGGTYRFVLTEALQPFVPVANIHSTSTGQWSQIWVASVRSIGDDTVDFGTVVLKIVQPSLLPIPMHQALSHVYRNSSPRQLACTEEYFYDQLRGVQGHAVPYFFGRDEVLMPNGEKAHVLVMEHIKPGTNLKVWCAPHGEAEKMNYQAKIKAELPSILLAAYNSYRAVNACNVLHKDVHPRNMLLFGDAGEVTVVIIDFAFSKLELDLSRVSLAEPQRAVGWIMQACANDFGKPMLAEWAQVEGNLPLGCKWHARLPTLV